MPIPLRSALEAAKQLLATSVNILRILLETPGEKVGNSTTTHCDAKSRKRLTQTSSLIGYYSTGVDTTYYARCGCLGTVSGDATVGEVIGTGYGELVLE